MTLKQEIDKMVGVKKPYNLRLNIHDVNALDKIAAKEGVDRAKLIDLAIKRLIKSCEVQI